MNESFLARNIVLLPPKVVKDKLIELSKLINNLVPSKVVLDKQTALPHISIYQLKYPAHESQAINHKLKHISETTSSFIIKCQPISLVLGTVFLDVVSPNLPLQNLHNQVVDGLNLLRRGMYFEDELNLPNITTKQLKMIHKYGHLIVKDTFQPHFTLTRPVDPDSLDGARKLIPDDFSLEFRIDALHLADRGPNGTCPQILHTFEFSDSE